jgi:ferric-dicitrate binding protein FerR (iron transport regulator)
MDNIEELMNELYSYCYTRGEQRAFCELTKSFGFLGDLRHEEAPNSKLTRYQLSKLTPEKKAGFDKWIADSDYDKKNFNQIARLNHGFHSYDVITDKDNSDEYVFNKQLNKTRVGLAGAAGAAGAEACAFGAGADAVAPAASSTTAISF